VFQTKDFYNSYTYIGIQENGVFSNSNMSRLGSNVDSANIKKNPLLRHNNAA